MRTHRPALRTTVWTSWWERRKAFRATTTPATWIQPSSGQYTLYFFNRASVPSAIDCLCYSLVSVRRIDYIRLPEPRALRLPRGTLLVNCMPSSTGSDRRLYSSCELAAGQCYIWSLLPTGAKGL